MTKAMPITIRGVRYENAEEAAKAIGVKRSTIYSALYRNTLDTVGTGTGRMKKNPRGGRPKEIVLGGKRFRTLREASLYLGLAKGTLSRILNRGGERARGNILRLVMKKNADVENAALRARTSGK